MLLVDLLDLGHPHELDLDAQLLRRLNVRNEELVPNDVKLFSSSCRLDRLAKSVFSDVDAVALQFIRRVIGLQ